MKIRFLFIFFVLSGLVFGQVELSGNVDFIVSSAGKDSKFITNGVNGDFTHPFVSMKQFNLFLFTDLDEEFFFEGRIQFDNLGSGNFGPPAVSLANLTWAPLEKPFSITLGRFITPFGLYPRRQLAVDNSFITPPLAYGYFLNISNSLGFTPGLGDDDDYTRDGTDNIGMPTVYFCGYATGGKFSWDVIEDLAILDLGVSNIAVASPKNNTNLSTFNVLGRLEISPAPFWIQGFSGSSGSFFEKTEDNKPFNQLGKYKETVFGTDWVIAYSYFEFTGEAIYTMWNVPWWSKKNGAFFTDDQGKLKEYKLENYSIYADLRYEPPFLVGSYVAARYEVLGFPRFEDDIRTGLSNEGIWDNEVRRYSFVLGYKIQRSVLLKVAYWDQKINNYNPDLEDYVLQSTLTILF